MPITLATASLALLCAALWGGTAVAIRFSQDDWPPLGTAGLRFALGTLFLAAWCRIEGQSLALRSGQLRPVLVVGGLLFVQIGLFHVGLAHTSSGHGSVMIGSNPVWVALLAHFALRGDPLSLTKVVGLAVATGGVVTVFAGQQASEAAQSATVLATAGEFDLPTLLGDAIVLASGWLLATKTVYTKHALSTIEPSKLLFWSNLLGTLLLLTSGLALEGVDRFTYSNASMLGLLYQGLVVAGFCFAAWTSLLRRHRASQLAVFGFAQPLFGICFGMWFRHDLLNPWLIVGGGGVALGILIVTRENRTQARRERRSPADAMDEIDAPSPPS